MYWFNPDGEEARRSPFGFLGGMRHCFCDYSMIPYKTPWLAAELLASGGIVRGVAIKWLWDMLQGIRCSRADTGILVSCWA